MSVLMLPLRFNVIWYWTIRSSFLDVTSGNVEITKAIFTEFKTKYSFVS